MGDEPSNLSINEVAPRWRLRAVSPWRWGPTLLVFAIGALAASVIIPAQATSRIIELFQELNSAIEPAGAEAVAEVNAVGRLSLVSNALLVLAAAAAITGIIVHMLRERQLMSVLRERATREASLRAAAESLAGAFTLDDIAREIARTAVAVLPAHGAFVLDIEETVNDTPRLIVRSTAGSEVPVIGATCALAGSLMERAILSAAPMICRMQQDDALMRNVAMIKPSISALVIPLHDGETAKGALVVLSATGFDSDDMIWARTYEHIATLAYEKVRLLDSANQGRRKLENVIDSRSRLMRGFSHDVKNPLGAADGYTALILEGVYGKLSPQQQESMERVRRSINVALALIDDLNDFARAEAGKVKFNIAMVDVAKLTHSIGAQYRASAHAKGLTLDVDIAPDLPTIKTDAARLRQIVSNLVSNGIKYTDAGSIQLRASESFDRNSKPAGIRFEVRDTGPGIPASQRALIFDEFSRLETTNHPGAGLGLPISKLLAEMLGGSISVESEVGIGSTFSLWIPQQPLNYPESQHAVPAGGYDRETQTGSFTSLEGI